MKIKTTETSLYTAKLKSVTEIKTKDGVQTLVETEVLTTVYGRRRKSIRLIRKGLQPGFFKKNPYGVVRIDDITPEPEMGYDAVHSYSFWSDSLDTGPGGIPIRWPSPGGSGPSTLPGATGPDVQPGTPGGGPGGTGGSGSFPGTGAGSGGGGSGGGSSPGTPHNPGPFEQLCSTSKDPQACIDFMTTPLPIPPGRQPDDSGGGHTGGDTPPDTGGPDAETADTGIFVF